MLNINPIDVQQVLKASLDWFIWIIKNMPLYLLIVFLGGLIGLYFEQDNIAQLKVCAAKLEAEQKNERSSP